MNKIIMRNAIEELEYQITRLSNEVVINVLGFEKNPYSFIENSITSPLVFRAIIDYITIKSIGLNKKESRDQLKLLIHEKYPNTASVEGRAATEVTNFISKIMIFVTLLFCRK